MSGLTEREITRVRQQQQTLRYRIEQLQNSKAYSPLAREEDFPIKFIPTNEDFKTFHKTKERERKESVWLGKFRLSFALALILMLALFLVATLMDK